MIALTTLTARAVLGERRVSVSVSGHARYVHNSADKSV